MALNPDLTLQLATPADADEVLNLYHSLIGSPGCTWSYAYPAAENVTKDMGNQALWVLRIGGELAGAVTIGPAGDVGLLGWEPQHPAELARLAVSPVFQDRGLASLLIEHALATARQGDFDGAVLLVSPPHAQARHLYEKFGFRPDGEVFGWDHMWVRYQQSF